MKPRQTASRHVSGRRRSAARTSIAMLLLRPTTDWCAGARGFSMAKRAPRTPLPLHPIHRVAARVLAPRRPRLQPGGAGEKRLQPSGSGRARRVPQEGRAAAASVAQQRALALKKPPIFPLGAPQCGERETFRAIPMVTGDACFRRGIYDGCRTLDASLAGDLVLLLATT